MGTFQACCSEPNLLEDSKDTQNQSIRKYPHLPDWFTNKGTDYKILELTPLSYICDEEDGEFEEKKSVIEIIIALIQANKAVDEPEQQGKCMYYGRQVPGKDYEYGVRLHSFQYKNKFREIWLGHFKDKNFVKGQKINRQDKGTLSIQEGTFGAKELIKGTKMVIKNNGNEEFTEWKGGK